MNYLRMSKAEEDALIVEFNGNTGTRALCKKYKRSLDIIRRIWLTKYTEEDIKLRGSRLCAYHKVGSKNPMYGKRGAEHPNAIETSYCNGYIHVFAPHWYTGAIDGGRVYEHILVYCAVNSLTELPPRHVVHHKDGNKINNCPTNLQLMTISEHMKLHNLLRRLEGATTISQESTPQESVEIGDTPLVGDDIVWPLW